jgi:hypothetical protein
MFGSVGALQMTAFDGPVRIQYKCLVLIYVFPVMKLLFPKQNYNVLCPSSYAHVCERFIYFQDRSAYSAANRSQTHECGIWD